MKIQLTHKGQSYQANLGQGINLSSVLSNENKLKAFYAPDIEIKPFEVEGFVGDIQQGSPVNFKNVFLNPHGNGTHTECVAHIQDIDCSIYQALDQTHYMADLLSVSPSLVGEDQVIEKDQLLSLEEKTGDALILRTHTFVSDKINYSGQNPTYIHPAAMSYIVEKGYQHILLDLPSVDKEEDGGTLVAHKIFFEVDKEAQKNKTITEMLCIPDEVEDGLYLLDIQVINLHLDASPSRIMIYPVY